MPCDWTLTHAQCEGTSCTHLDSLEPDVAAAIEDAAVEWLWNATNRRYGNCPVTILPCLNGCQNNYGQPWAPYRLAAGSWSWVNVGCASCSTLCSCSTPSQVILPTKGTVTEVRVDGTPLDPLDWNLLNSQILIRTDGGSWPTCQDLTAEPPTWEVDFIPGLAVPGFGSIVAGVLACQLARRVCGASCDLPANASSVSRQGVTIFLDPNGGQTGIWLIDQWVNMVNTAPSRVYSPDVPVPVMTVAVSGSS